MPHPDFVLQPGDVFNVGCKAYILYDYGEYVKPLQSLLQAQGYDLQVDGIFGPGTEAAVKAFQAAANLTADGIVGPKTWCALTQ